MPGSRSGISTTPLVSARNAVAEGAYAALNVFDEPGFNDVANER